MQSVILGAIARRATCIYCCCKVVADSFCRFQGCLKVVDICSRELCCDVAGGAAEDRVDKVFLLEEHTPVVWAFPSVVERKDARVFLGKKVSPHCVSAHSVIVMG